MKLLLDSTVVIAAFAARGLCKDILELCLAEHELFFSEKLLKEIHRGLIKKIKVPETLVESIVEFLRHKPSIVRAIEISPSECRDTDDVEVLGVALKAETDAIVTGDNDLLVLKSFKSIPILSPREFWEFLNSGKILKFSKR